MSEELPKQLFRARRDANSPKKKEAILRASGYAGPRDDGTWISPGLGAIFTDIDAAFDHRKDLDYTMLNVQVLRRCLNHAKSGKPFPSDFLEYLEDLVESSQFVIDHFKRL